MTVTVLEGHVLDVLASLPAEHFHAAVTSPPYWQARRYGCPPVVWADPEGAPPCPRGAHAWEDATVRHVRHADDGSAGALQRTSPRSVGRRGEHPGASCARCGAWRGELGQEPEVGLYVAHLVECMRAVRRVLRRDGCLWVNLAGCYFSDPGGQNGASSRAGGFRGVSNKAVTANRQVGRRERTRSRDGWLKPLDYVDVPGLFARAMQADGWLWRADVTWVKGSPLPESVAGTRWERCRRAPAWPPGGQRAPAARDTPHTDPADRVGRSTRRRAAGLGGLPWLPQVRGERGLRPAPRERPADEGHGGGPAVRPAARLLLRPGGGAGAAASEHARAPRAGPRGAGRLCLRPRDRGPVGGAGAPRGRPHGGAQPVGLVGDQRRAARRGPLRGLPHGARGPVHPAGHQRAGLLPPLRGAVGADRGAPVRAPGRRARPRPAGQGGHQGAGRRVRLGGGTAGDGGAAPRSAGAPPPAARTPAGLAPAPCRVLDPFGGSGRTGIAADRLGRDCTLVELQPEYVAMVARRVSADAPLLTEVAVVGPPGPEERGT